MSCGFLFYIFPTFSYISLISDIDQKDTVIKQKYRMNTIFFKLKKNQITSPHEHNLLCLKRKNKKPFISQYIWK